MLLLGICLLVIFLVVVVAVLPNVEPPIKIILSLAIIVIGVLLAIAKGGLLR